MSKTKYYTEIPLHDGGYVHVLNRRKSQMVELQISPNGEYYDPVPLTNEQVDLLIEALKRSKEEVE